MDTFGFECLNAFFKDHQTAMSYLLDTRAKIRYLLQTYGVDELFQESRRETIRYKTKSGKNPDQARHYLELAKKLYRGGKKLRNQCEYFFKQALLNMSLDIKQDQFEESASYICFAIAKMFAKRSSKYLPALDCVNRAIELAGDNKRTDYFPMLATLKIKLQIKLQQYNEARKTLQLLQKSMTDSGGGGGGHVNRQVHHYERILREQSAEPDAEILPLPDGHDDNLLEWDENCYIEVHSQVPAKGRHMRTAGAIPIGTYLVKDRVVSVVFESYVSLSVGQFVTYRCNFCHDTIGDIFYPCRKCTRVVFCSAKCEKLSVQRGAHRFECGLTDLFDKCRVALHVFRMVAIFGIKNAVRFYQDKSNTLTVQQHLSEQRQNSQPFELLDSESQWRVFALINSFVEHREHADSTIKSELLFWAVKVVLLINHQQHYFDNMATNCSLLNDFFLLVESVAVLMRKLLFNAFGWTEMDPSDMNKNNLIANCVCLVQSFINHSCDPTAYWEIANGVIALSTARSLEPNDEITISYGPHQFVHFYERQRRLADYKFVCACSICLQDVKKLLCLGCTHCGGPVYPPEQIEDTQMAKCMLCGQLFEDYQAVMNQVIQARLQLLFQCRFANLKVDSDARISLRGQPSVGQLVRQLSACLYSQCEPLQQCISATCDFLTQNKLPNEALEVVTNYLAIIDMEQSWQGGDALKGILLLSKWHRQLEAGVKNGEALDGGQRTVSDQIQETLARLWKDFQKLAKCNQSLNLIIELLEVSTHM